MSMPDVLFDFELDMQVEDFAYRDFTLEDFEVGRVGRKRMGWRGQMARDNRRNFNLESSIIKFIKVPSHKVGRIIGKDGCKIRALEFESKAKIKIGDSNRNETTVTLIGSPEATLIVAGLINELLEDRSSLS